MSDEKIALDRLGQPKGITRVVTPDGDRVIATPIAENLLGRKLLFKDDYGVINASNTAEFDKLVAEYGMCDFCSAPEAPHTLVVPDFQMDVPVGTTIRLPSGDDAPVTHNSTGGWAACDECFALVKDNRRRDLLERSVQHFGGGKFAAGAIKNLHAQFWKAFDEIHTAAGGASIALDFIEDRMPKDLSAKLKGRDVRIAAIRRLTGLTEDETEALLKSDLTYGQVARKISEWTKKLGSDKDQIRALAELTEAGLYRPMPLGSLPHWQIALDMKFEAMTTLQKAISATDKIAQHFPDAIDLNDMEAIREKVRQTQKIDEFRKLGYAEDVAHLKLAEVYSFNEDTMEAIRMGAGSIPHETPLSAITLPPNTSAGFFWFAKPFPVASSPVAGDVTNALLWGWEVTPGASYLAAKMMGKEQVTDTPILRFSAYVIDSTDGKPMMMPSTKWTWPLNATFHEMIGINTLSHRKLYGPGGQFEHMPNLAGEKETMQCIAEMSLFFLMACVWFKQKILVGVPGHVERHARKRYVREHKLPKVPEVKVIALRASEHQRSETPSNGNGHGERKYNKWRWVVDGHPRLQPCGPGGKDRKLIWIDPYPKGPKDAPLKPKAQKVYAVIR